MVRYLPVLLFFVLAASCRPKVFPPRPPGYYRIDTPAEHRYQLFDRPEFPYTFEYPVYGTVEKDTFFAKDRADNAYWININFKAMGGMLNLTYKEINATNTLPVLLEGAWDLSFFHHKKADYINEKELTEPGKGAMLYVVGGNAASRYQFTVTDSVKHFLRGALYFDVTPNADSLKPATDFLEKDIMHMISTLKWKGVSGTQVQVMDPLKQ